MRGFAEVLRLELLLQRRSFVLPATAVSTLVLCGFVLLLPARPLSPRLAAFFVFMDPATIGLSFVGAMVLMERAQGTLEALAVTPLTSSAYVAAKGVTLTLLTLLSGLIVVAVATGGRLDLPRLLLALVLCSSVAVLIGLACVARAASMNHLVMTLLWVSTLLYLPLLAHFGLVSGPGSALLAPIPSYAMLTVLTSALDPSSATLGVQIAALAYLALWSAAGSWWAVRAFQRSLVSQGR